ncbi:hypothetical protein BWZ22_05105 [Seonamhaeicola sp. S2-3]|nr:hypothetical protein BWZ22_05105 [Seonamhaeicola sp. S2-3]
MMKYSLGLLIFCFLICNDALLAQDDNFDALGETSAALNHKVSKNYTTNFTLRSRYFLHQNSFGYRQQQLDVFHYSTFNLNLSKKLGLGIYYRNRDWFNSGSDELRLSQQFNYTKQQQNIRFGHRIRLEQRIFDSFTDFRQRYRFSINFPLNGNSLENANTHFTASLEGLWIVSKNKAPLLDKRTTAKIGWQLSQDLKFETGLEYRLESFNVHTKNYLFLLTGAVCRL